jgi:hypothetical protein
LNAPATAWWRTWPSCRLLLFLLQPTMPCLCISPPDTTTKAAFEPMCLDTIPPLKSTLGRFRSCCLAALVWRHSCATAVAKPIKINPRSPRMTACVTICCCHSPGCTGSYDCPSMSSKSPEFSTVVCRN